MTKALNRAIDELSLLLRSNNPLLPSKRNRPRSLLLLPLLLLPLKRKQGLSFQLAVFHPYRALPALVEGARLRAKAAGVPPQPERIMALHDAARAALDDILVRDGRIQGKRTQEKP